MHNAEHMPCPRMWPATRPRSQNVIACRETEAINKDESKATSSSRERLPTVLKVPSDSLPARIFLCAIHVGNSSLCMGGYY